MSEATDETSGTDSRSLLAMASTAMSTGAKTLYLSLAGAVAVATVLSGVRWVASEYYLGPEPALRGYFTALSEGDAATALEYTDLRQHTGLDHGLLNSAVLAGGVRPTEIQVGEVSRQIVESDHQDALVPIEYLLGQQRVQTSYRVRLRADQSGLLPDWRLVEPFGQVRLELPAAGGTTRINGVPLPRAMSSRPLAVFPGRYRVQLEANELLTSAETSFTAAENTGPVRLSPQLAPGANATANRLVKEFLDRCTRTDGPRERACPSAPAVGTGIQLLRYPTVRLRTRWSTEVVVETEQPGAFRPGADPAAPEQPLTVSGELSRDAQGRVVLVAR